MALVLHVRALWAFIHAWLTAMPVAPLEHTEDMPVAAPVAVKTTVEKELPTMSVSLSAVASALASVNSTVASTVALYQVGAELIHVAENAYNGATASGATKKAGVLAGLEQLCLVLGHNWDSLRGELSSWVDMVVQSWNALKKVTLPGLPETALAVAAGATA